MNATFEAWLLEHVTTQGYRLLVQPGELLQAFVRKVNARAEAKMLQTHKLEGSHYAAMRELLKEWGIEE